MVEVDDGAFRDIGGVISLLELEVDRGGRYSQGDSKGQLGEAMKLKMHGEQVKPGH